MPAIHNVLSAYFLYSSSEERVLVTFGVYSIVRHPMATGTLIFFWAHPTKVCMQTSVTLVFNFLILDNGSINGSCHIHPVFVRSSLLL